MNYVKTKTLNSHSIIIFPCNSLFSQDATSNKYRSSLKELQNPVLSFILVWSLFCLIRLYVGLHFLQFPWKTSFSSFYAFCVFCFESNLLNQDIKIYVLSCYVILLCNFVLTLYKNSPLINNTKLLIKILLCKNMLSERF